MKKVISLMLVIAMALSLVACGGNSAPAASEATADVAMQYITADEAKELVNSDEYVFFDVRKAADSSANSIPGAQAWDMDAAKEGDAEAGKATMTKATEGLDKKIKKMGIVPSEMQKVNLKKEELEKLNGELNWEVLE